MPVEMLSMLGGSVVGFLFRYLAEKRQNDKDLFERLIKLNQATNDNYNSAVQRVSIDLGRNIRQIIVLTILFGTLVAPFILPFFGVPTFVEVDTVTAGGPFGLVSSVAKKYFVEINGFLYTSENRQILVAVVGFYFGSAAAANKS